jgi:hypothetical protein
VVADMVVARLKVISYEKCPLVAENELIATWSSATGVSQSTIMSQVAANITVGTWIVSGGPTMTSGKKQLFRYFGRLSDMRKQWMTCFVGEYSTLGTKASQFSESAHQAIERLTSPAMSLVDIVGKFIEMCESNVRHSENRTLRKGMALYKEEEALLRVLNHTALNFARARVFSKVALQLVHKRGQNPIGILMTPISL